MTIEQLCFIFICFILIYLTYKIKKAFRRTRFKKQDISNTDNQLDFLKNIGLFAARPINAEAYRIFSLLEDIAHQVSQQEANRFRVFAEVSMGAFIKTDQSTGNKQELKRAYSSFGSKRVDFLVIDEFGQPALVVEYHGSGHYQTNAKGRDAVKKYALQKAQIPLLEITTKSSVKKCTAAITRALHAHAQHIFT